MERINEEITKIKSGCIDYYYSLKVETKLNYYELCETIQANINRTLENYNLEISSILQKDMENKMTEEGIEELSVRIDCDEKQVKNKILNSELDQISQKIVRIEISNTQKGVKIIPISEANQHIEETEKEIEYNYKKDLEIYGQAFVNNYRVINLPPYKVQLINDSFVFVDALLHVFKNGMMILKITIPIKDIEITPLFENNEDEYIKDIIDIYKVGDCTKEKTIEEIKKKYYQYIYDCNKKITNIISVSKVLRNIILADFEGVPSDVRDITEDVKEKLYRIIVAPIQKRDDISFKDRANIYLAENSYTYDGIKYITSSMGKCISIIDSDTIDYLENILDSNKRNEAYRIGINSVRRNIEFSFLIILLKNMNSSITYFEKELNLNNINKIQKEYNFNLIFILQLQQTCFGSVREQLAFLENKMIYFLDVKSRDERMKAIDAIIENDNNTKSLNFQNFLSIGGFLLTVIFGLPAIYETLTILRKSNLFINKDIAILTIDNCSIAIWIALTIILTVILYWKNINVKNLILKWIYKLKIFFLKNIKRSNKD